MCFCAVGKLAVAWRYWRRTREKKGMPAGGKFLLKRNIDGAEKRMKSDGAAVVCPSAAAAAAVMEAASVHILETKF